MTNGEAIPESWRAALEPVLLNAESRRLGGWLRQEEERGATIYPPLHYAVLALATAPFHVLATMGLLELEQLHVNTAVFVVQRLVSVVMALGAAVSGASLRSSWGAPMVVLSGLIVVALMSNKFSAARLRGNS